MRAAPAAWAGPATRMPARGGAGQRPGGRPRALPPLPALALLLVLALRPEKAIAPELLGRCSGVSSAVLPGMTKPLPAWTVGDVKDWMYFTLGMPHYAGLIQQHAIDGVMLEWIFATNPSSLLQYADTSFRSFPRLFLAHFSLILCALFPLSLSLPICARFRAGTPT